MSICSLNVKKSRGNVLFSFYWKQESSSMFSKCSPNPILFTAGNELKKKKNYLLSKDYVDFAFSTHY